ANCMVHCGYEPTAADDAVRHPLKALMVKLRGIRTDGAMAPEISLDKQRPAEFVFSRHVEDTMAQIERDRAAAPTRPTAAE
ncbi:MAG: adenosyl-hopene transferase HpnH, partial [Stellaceae bacterium]